MVQQAQSVRQRAQPFALCLLSERPGHPLDAYDFIRRDRQQIGQFRLLHRYPLPHRGLLRTAAAGPPRGGEGRIDQVLLSERCVCPAKGSYTLQHPLQQGGTHVGVLGPGTAGKHVRRASQAGREQPHSDKRPTPSALILALVLLVLPDVAGKVPPVSDPVGVARLCSEGLGAQIVQ
ncbi:hypothetical protein AB0E82_28080 [Streptomyces anulatus]|uniref:hypothetical protein n=1 Tax=Streptomyces anulatus TaxID=1892 RepID=UPI0033E7D7B2